MAVVPQPPSAAPAVRAAAAAATKVMIVRVDMSRFLCIWGLAESVACEISD